MNQCIIYKFVCDISGKFYIGQTWRSLKRRCGKGKSYIGCLHLYSAIQKYGIQNFHYEVLTICGTQETANYWEDYFCEKLGARNPKIGYNIRSAGIRGKISEETKRKIGNANKGNNNGANNRGKKHSEEWKLNISKGLKSAYDTDIRMPWNKGHKSSKQTRNKISKSISSWWSKKRDI